MPALHQDAQGGLRPCPGRAGTLSWERGDPATHPVDEFPAAFYTE